MAMRVLPTAADLERMPDSPANPHALVIARDAHGLSRKQMSPNALRVLYLSLIHI